MIRKVIITVLLANNVLGQSGMPDLLVPDIGAQGAPDCTQECYIGPTQPNSTYLTGGSFKGILAGKCIHLLNGFHAGNFNAGGKFNATISNSLLDLKVIAPYSATGSSVGKYEKYELGIKLPSTIQAQIDNYLAGGLGINPYDPDQIEISFNAFRTTPFRHSISGYAFYYKEFEHNSTNTSWDNAINDPNKDYTWRLRMAPDEVGEWSGSISVNVNHTTVSIGCFNFNCVPSNNQGYLKVGNYDRLKFSETGNQFWGIGQNIGFVNSFSCAYYSAQPQHYNAWRGYISDLASSGGNFFRFFTHTASFMPELNKLGDYDEAQPHMWELDKMFDLAHDKNMHFIFCLDNFQTYDINDPFCFTNGWQNNPYHTTIPGVSQPIDFFQNSIAKKYYKNRLRYMLSRWGYSSNIAVFEILNEIDQTGREYAVGNSEDPIRNDYKSSSNYRQATASWHWEMAEYIKSIDRGKHLVSTSYSDKPEIDDNTYSSPYMNVTSIHSYGLDRRINLDRNNVLFPIIRKYKKPSTIGEMGNGYFLVDNCFDLEFHNSIWASAFMGGYSVGLNWNSWEKNEYRANNISHLRWFFDNNVDLSKARDVLFGSEDELHKMTYTDYSFIKAQRLERSFEYYYLTDLKGYFAGWVHNMSCNWWNYRYIDPCIKSIVASGQATNPDAGKETDQNLVSPYTIAERNIKLTSGLSFTKKYELKWFYTRIIQHSLTTLTIAPNLLGKAKIPVPTTDENYPDWAFVLKSKDCFFCKQSNLGHVVLDPDTLDCPNDTIIATGTYEEDSTGIFNYNWSFGNGQFSNVAHPKIYYSIPGSYNIRLIVTDTLGQIDTLDQRFIVQDCRPTVGGFLKRDTICGGGPAVGDTIIFIDSSGSIVNSISYVVTDSSGFFSFNKAEVHSLDTAIRYRIATKSGLAIADTGSRTIHEWINLSAVVLYLAPDFPQQYFTKVTTGDIVNLGRTTSSSWGDYDGDGDLDVIAFCNPANALYRNDCDGNFTQVTGNALSTPTTPFNSTPAEWIDYDNDGDLDIILYKLAGGTGVPQSAQLYQNDGSGNFTLITTGQMVNDTLSPRSASIVDFDNDGYLDVFVANRNRPNVLYRNTGAGDFIKVTGSILNSLCTPTLSQGSTWGDYDNDGDMDVYIGGGGAYSCFYQNNGNGTFTQNNDSLLTTVVGSNYGPAWVDYDNDSDLDLFLQIAFAPNLLFMNNNNGTFSKVTVAPFLNGNENAQGGPTFGDYDNDGDLDLFLANVNGHPNRFYVNNGDGTFTENINEIITNDVLKESFAATFADIDNDGDLDLYVNNVNNPYNDNHNFLYVNKGSCNNWVKIKCIGSQTNKQAVGARVYVKATINGVETTQMREINGNCNLTGGANGVTANEAHFGLANATAITELKIVWPKSGITQIFNNVQLDKFYDVTETDNQILIHSDCNNSPATVAKKKNTGHPSVLNNNPIVEGALLTNNLQSLANSIRVYPNPNSGTITVELNRLTNTQTPTEFRLFNLTGQLVFTKNLRDSNNSIDLMENGVENGMYYFTISSNGITIKQDKLIVIK